MENNVFSIHMIDHGPELIFLIGITTKISCMLAHLRSLQ